MQEKLEEKKTYSIRGMDARTLDRVSLSIFFLSTQEVKKKVFHFKKVDTSNGASKSKLLMVLEV